MGTAKQRDNINESIEFGLRVSLDDCFKLSKQRFNDVTADKKRELSDCEFALDVEMPVKPRQQAGVNFRSFREPL